MIASTPDISSVVNIASSMFDVIPALIIIAFGVSLGLYVAKKCLTVISELDAPTHVNPPISSHLFSLDTSALIQQADRQITLPKKCPACGAPVNPDLVVRAKDGSAMCAYCGTVLSQSNEVAHA